MNAAVSYGLEHYGQALNFCARHGIPPDQREDVVQGALLRCVRRGDQNFRYPQAYFYAAMKSQLLDWRRGRKPAVHLTDELASMIPTPSAPAYRSLNGFGSTRKEMKAVIEWLGTIPRRWQVVRKHLRQQALTAPEAEMIDELYEVVKDARDGG